MTCETDDDCAGRGLPNGWVHCDIPRPGEGFCNPYGFGYQDGECVQNVPATTEPPP